MQGAGNPLKGLLPSPPPPPAPTCEIRGSFAFFGFSYLRGLQNRLNPTFSQQITICYVIRRMEKACPPVTLQVMVGAMDNLAFTNKYIVWINSNP